MTPLLGIQLTGTQNSRDYPDKHRLRHSIGL